MNEFKKELLGLGLLALGAVGMMYALMFVARHM